MVGDVHSLDRPWRWSHCVCMLCFTQVFCLSRWSRHGAGKSRHVLATGSFFASGTSCPPLLRLCEPAACSSAVRHTQAVGMSVICAALVFRRLAWLAQHTLYHNGSWHKEDFW